MIKNKFAKWVEWLLDLLPLFAVLFSCLYVTFNSNAFESYGGTTENTVINETITSTSDLNTIDTYYLTNVYANNTNANIGNSNQTIFISNIVILENQSQYDLSNTYKIGFYQSANGYNLGYYFWYSDTQNYNISSNTHFLISFNYLSNNLPTNNVLNNSNSLFKKVYNGYNSLENVFTYSLNKFNELGFDKLNFINWFTGLFLNGTSNVYTTFINGYLNYFLLVECTYVLPMVLYWFIHLGERLISKLEYGGDK